MQEGVAEKRSKGKQNKMVQSSIILRCPSFSHSMSCSGQALLSQRHLSIDVLKRTCYEKKKDIVK